jgi:DNA-binding LacI/PurR family transcriptional regulator
MAALRDIAAKAGVSVGTVSRILNQGRAHLYSEETRSKVLAASRQFGYRPNRSAQAMRQSKTRVIGFATVNISDQGYLENHGVYPFVVGLSRELAQHGYHVASVECSDLGDHANPEQPWAVKERFFDGLVVHYGLSDRAVRFAKDVGVPLVWWDSGVFEPNGCVYRDEIEVGRQVTRRLVEAGHRRIGFMVGRRGWQDYCQHQPIHYSYAQRFESYRDEMRAHGMKEVPLLGYDPAELAQQIDAHQVTAVIIQGTNFTAIDAAARLLGKRIPQDLSVATLDREARILPRGPATGGMLYDRVDVGTHAARMMLDILEGGHTAVPSVRYVGEYDAGDTVFNLNDQ